MDHTDGGGASDKTQLPSDIMCRMDNRTGRVAFLRASRVDIQIEYQFSVLAAKLEDCHRLAR